MEDFSVVDFDYFGDSFKAWCLVPATSKASLGRGVVDAVEVRYGGLLRYAVGCLELGFVGALLWLNSY